MAKLTIHEALAELKVIDKKVEKKKAFIEGHLLRQEMFKDPLEKEGGSVVAIARERQAIGDLLERRVAIRRAIQEANSANKLEVGGKTRSVADWLVWRREVAPWLQKMLQEWVHRITSARLDAQRKGLGVGQPGQEAKPTDLVVHISENELAKSAEEVEEILGTLDGKLSVVNATLIVEV